MIHKIKTNSHDEWMELRKQYIGGSDAAAVVGLNPYSSPCALWAEKTGRVPGFEGNLATEVGTYLEEFVAQKFAKETGKKVRKCNQSILNDSYPFAIANIDREIFGEDAGLEIKTTDSLNLKKFKGGEYPANYYCQCMHYLAVTEKQRWYLAVLIGNKEFKWYTIERDDAEIAALMGAEAMLWDNVKKDIPPPVDGTRATSDALAAMYGECDSSESCDLLPYQADIENYLAINKQIKDLEARKNEVANCVKAFLGKSDTGMCDKFQVTWKPQTRRTFDEFKFVGDFPEIDIADYYKETSARVFRVTENKN